MNASIKYGLRGAGDRFRFHASRPGDGGRLVGRGWEACAVLVYRVNPTRKMELHSGFLARLTITNRCGHL